MTDREALLDRLERYPAERYPVQHATAQFHLGVALLDRGLLGEAVAALREAARLFPADRLPVEHAKAANALGAALRFAGRPRQAAAAFGRAALAFEAAGQQLEQGAAVFNLGLLEREAGTPERAEDAFSLARDLLDPSRAPAQAAAAAREQGASLLEQGDADGAAAALREATELADRAGDRAGLGAAANALGLAELGAGRVAEGVEALHAAAAANPRSVRPAEYAMAKANLALACERAGDQARARMYAGQGAYVPEAPEPVATQARGVLDRLGPRSGDALRVIAAEPAERRAAIVREELTAWSDAPADHRRREAGAWIEGQLDSREPGVDLAELLVGGLIELPPERCEAVARALVEAVPDGERGERFRSEVSRAMARFHVPQWTRLQELFTRLGAERGLEHDWR